MSGEGVSMANVGHKITAKGQVTIPKDIRDFLELESGDQVLFIRRGDEVIVEGVSRTLLDLRGTVNPRRRPEDPDAIRNEVRRTVAKQVADG